MEKVLRNVIIKLKELDLLYNLNNVQLIKNIM
jgi:hypothetical protein